jgi:hypothetical protein
MHFISCVIIVFHCAGCPRSSPAKKEKFMTDPLKTRRAAILGAMSLTTLLAACGGGGGGSSAPVSATSAPNQGPSAIIGTPSTAASAASSAIPSGTTQSTPTYPAGSAQLAMFTTINAYRQQCGFPAMQQNTILDQAAQNHTSYMAQNGGVVTDDEVAGNPGFTGVTGQDRADALGWPSNVPVGTGNTGTFTTGTYGQPAPTASLAQIGQYLIEGLVSGVYHAPIIISPLNLVGLGITTMSYAYQGTTYPLYLGGIVLGQNNANVAGPGAPLTFPCQGVSGVPYAGTGEIPTPPNTNGPWGTPVVVIGNLSDVVVLQSGTMTAPNGTVIPLNLLNSSNDPNKELGAYEAVAYPTSPLSANTTYSVMLTGTINGTAFSRNFTFTTGNVIG